MKSGRLQKAGPTKTRGVEFVGWKLVGAAYVEERPASESRPYNNQRRGVC